MSTEPKVLETLTIHYDVGSSTINMNDPRNADALRKTKDFLNKNPGCYIDVSSSTSSTGKSGFNQDLSGKRTAAGIAALGTQVDPNLIKANSIGEAVAVQETGDEVEDERFRKTSYRVVTPGFHRDAKVTKPPKHVILINKDSNPVLQIVGDSPNMKANYVRDAAARNDGTTVSFQAQEIIPVIDVTNPEPRKIILHDVSKETLQKMVIPTYDPTGGRSNLLTKITHNNDANLVVQVSHNNGQSWTSICQIEGSGKTPTGIAGLVTQFATLAPDGTLHSVKLGETHKASQVVSTELLNNFYPAKTTQGQVPASKNTPDRR